jgi:hypothetical protein
MSLTSWAVSAATAPRTSIENSSDPAVIEIDEIALALEIILVTLEQEFGAGHGPQAFAPFATCVGRASPAIGLVPPLALILLVLTERR